MILEGYCALCLTKTNRLWCAACEKDILSTINRCPICAKPGTYNAACGNCLNNKPAYCNTEILFQYQYPAKHLIKAFKFYGRSELSIPFAELMAKKLIKKERFPDVLIPMPLHKKRQKQRGYNQSLLLANQIAKRLRLKVNAALCERVKDTAPQSTLPLSGRRKNIRNAFLLKSHISFNHIAIVDDVVTSGSTANELASLFKKAGCDAIEIWTIART